MAFFDATLFTRRARGSTARPTRRSTPPVARGPRPRPAGPGRARRGSPAFLRWGSWIGGDRDGNPSVTAETTERTLRIQADHVLRGYEAVAARLMQTVAAATSQRRRAAGARDRLARDAEDLPETDRQLRRRFPDEPYRQRFGFIAERLRRTRAALTGEAAPRPGHYADAAELDAELAEIQTRSSRTAGPRRLGRGRRAPLAARDVRVPPRVARGPPAQRRPSGRARGARATATTRPTRASRRAWPSAEVAGDVPGHRRDARRGSASAACHRVHRLVHGRAAAT